METPGQALMAARGSKALKPLQASGRRSLRRCLPALLDKEAGLGLTSARENRYGAGTAGVPEPLRVVRKGMGSVEPASPQHKLRKLDRPPLGRN